MELGAASAYYAKVHPLYLIVAQLQLHRIDFSSQVVNLRWRFFELSPTHNQKVGEIGNTPEEDKERSLFPSVLRPIKSYRQEQTSSKYSPKGSEVKLEVVFQERLAIFRIQDFGIGIPQQDQELMFKAFQRGSNVEAVAGKGLGLAIVKQCVDLQEGEMFVESEEGIGTTFTVKLPMNLREVTKNFSFLRRKPHAIFVPKLALGWIDGVMEVRNHPIN